MGSKMLYLCFTTGCLQIMNKTSPNFLVHINVENPANITYSWKEIHFILFHNMEVSQQFCLFYYCSVCSVPCSIFAQDNTYYLINDITYRSLIKSNRILTTLFTDTQEGRRKGYLLVVEKFTKLLQFVVFHYNCEKQ